MILQSTHLMLLHLDLYITFITVFVKGNAAGGVREF